jgi:hypothetical protein
MEFVSYLVIRLVTGYSRLGNSVASIIYFYLEDASSRVLRNGAATCYSTRWLNLDGHNNNNSNNNNNNKSLYTLKL